MVGLLLFKVCAPYPHLDRHVVEAGFAKEAVAEGEVVETEGAAEAGITAKESLEGSILEVVAEVGIKISEARGARGRGWGTAEEEGAQEEGAEDDGAEEEDADADADADASTEGGATYTVPETPNEAAEEAAPPSTDSNDSLNILQNEEAKPGAGEGGTAFGGIAKEGDAGSLEEGGVREDIAEEGVVVDGAAEVRAVVVGEEIVREEIKNRVHKLSPGSPRVIRSPTDIHHCSNALLVPCITYTHKNCYQSNHSCWGKPQKVLFVIPSVENPGR